MNLETMRELSRQLENAKRQLYKLQMKSTTSTGDKIMIEELKKLIDRLAEILKGRETT